MPNARLLAAMVHRGIGRRHPEVRERILRLNPVWHEGSSLRGWRPKHNPCFVQDLVGKREFIERYGRAAWEQTPNGEKIKYGRRHYVTRVFVEDNMWMIYAPGANYHARRVFQTSRFSNDPRGCPFEWGVVKR